MEMPPSNLSKIGLFGLFELSLKIFASRVREAAIPVERIAGRVLLTAGGDDLVWPSILFAIQVQDRRAAHGLDTKVITSSTAGHRVHLQGEPTPGPEGMTMQRGGTAEGDAELGSRVWPALLNLLKLK
jgi:hypothetical protein